MNRIYVDSSTLVKRVFDEPESAHLDQAFTRSSSAGDAFATSALARVEVARVTRARLDVDPLRDVAAATAQAFLGISICAMSQPILESARIIGPPLLRTLDAIHLATAVSLGVDEVWTYDHRMAQTAEELGILSRSPA